MITTNTITTKESIIFFDDNMIPFCGFKLEDLGKKFEFDGSGGFFSELVDKVALQKKALPIHLYNLASTIQKLFPEIEWNWRNQFFRIEKELTQTRVSTEVYKNWGMPNLMSPRFQSDWAMFDFERELKHALESKASDKIINGKVDANLRLHKIKTRNNES